MNSINHKVPTSMFWPRTKLSSDASDSSEGVVTETDKDGSGRTGGVGLEGGLLCQVCGLSWWFGFVVVLQNHSWPGDLLNQKETDRYHYFRGPMFQRSTSTGKALEESKIKVLGGQKTQEPQRATQNQDEIAMKVPKGKFIEKPVFNKGALNDEDCLLVFLFAFRQPSACRLPDEESSDTGSQGSKKAQQTRWGPWVI